MKKLLLGASIVALSFATTVIFADDQATQTQPDAATSGQMQTTQPNADATNKAAATDQTATTTTATTTEPASDAKQDQAGKTETTTTN